MTEEIIFCSNKPWEMKRLPDICEFHVWVRSRNASKWMWSNARTQANSMKTKVKVGQIKRRDYALFLGLNWIEILIFFYIECLSVLGIRLLMLPAIVMMTIWNEFIKFIISNALKLKLKLNQMFVYKNAINKCVHIKLIMTFWVKCLLLLLLFQDLPFKFAQNKTFIVLAFALKSWYAGFYRVLNFVSLLLFNTFRMWKIVYGSFATVKGIFIQTNWPPLHSL